MKKQSDFDLIDELGRKLTTVLQTVEIASKIGIKIGPNAIATNLLEAKDLVNKLKSRMIEERRVPIAD